MHRGSNQLLKRANTVFSKGVPKEVDFDKSLNESMGNPFGNKVSKNIQEENVTSFQVFEA